MGMIGGLVIGLAVVLIMTAANVKPVLPLPVLGSVTPFSLISSEGKPFRLDDLGGKVWVADFIFTSCAGPCPLMSQKMARLQRTFRNVPALALVSFSVDPETDTPEVLSRYAGLLGANTDVWHFLTGEYEDIQKLAVEGFHLGSVENPIHHSTYFALVDSRGDIRGYYDSNDSNAMQLLITGIQLLLASS